jgi:hypothetical protein
MDDETKILFTDTNGFLQVRDLKDIPWKDLFPRVRTVDIMVAPRVIEELDKHKISTNQRLRDRSRLALQIIEKASREPDLALQLRDQPTRVRIVISTAPRFDWTAHPNLDSAKPDDQLVAEALSFGNGAAIFSHDAGPRIRARIAQIEAYEPDANWLLPIEQTDDQREITKLKRELKEALSHSPNIVAGLDKLDEAYEIRVIRPVVQPLDPSVAYRLASNFLARHPRVPFTPADDTLIGQIHGVSQSETKRYHEKYAAFEAAVHGYYANLHKRVWRAGAAVAINYYIRNDSGVAAEGLRIEFDLEGDGSLLASRDDAPFGRFFEEPDPPSKPRSLSDTLRPINFPTLKDHLKPRDPVAFYWFDRPEILSKHSALQCQEFRPTREYHDCIFVLAEDLPSNLGLRLHVEAANLPLPVNIEAKVIVIEQEVEWSHPIVQGILPNHIGKLLSS